MVSVPALTRPHSSSVMSKPTGKRSQARRRPQVPRHRLAVALQWLPDLAIWLGLVVSILVVYAQVGDFDFTTWDDDAYVYNNAHVLAGLTYDSLRWALTGVVVANWMPITLLSHMVDVQIFGLQSGWHHLLNVLLHGLSALLLFAFLRRATHARWPSAFVAFMFALHPLHVESVAWVAERKDVLCTFFWFLGLYRYVRYTERPDLTRYLLVLLPFCLGLMSKPMIVTFPFTLLLIDFWPLRRVQWPKSLLEKLPLFALSAAASVVTYRVQHSAGAIQGMPLATRTGNALISYVTYIVQTFWPARLVVLYPFPKSIAGWQAGAAAIAILAVSGLAIFSWPRRPYLAVGWFWYLGTLVPALGLVQVGLQSHADRYMYVPMLGLSVMLAWGAAEVAERWPSAKPAIATAAVASCVVWIGIAWKQTAYWRSSETLYQHALHETENNWPIEFNLAHYLSLTPGRRADAIHHYESVVRMKPDYAEAQGNLGLLLVTTPGRQSEALVHLEAAQRIHPEADREAILEGLRGAAPSR